MLKHNISFPSGNKLVQTYIYIKTLKCCINGGVETWLNRFSSVIPRQSESRNCGLVVGYIVTDVVQLSYRWKHGKKGRGLKKITGITTYEASSLQEYAYIKKTVQKRKLSIVSKKETIAVQKYVGNISEEKNFFMEAGRFLSY